MAEGSNQVGAVPELLICLFVVALAGFAVTNWRGYFRRGVRALVSEEAPLRGIPWWRNYDPESEAAVLSGWFRLGLGFFGIVSLYGVYDAIHRLVS